MPPPLFTHNDGVVEVSVYAQWRRIGYVMLVVFALFSAGTFLVLFGPGRETLTGLAIALPMLCLMVLPLFILASRKVVIDGRAFTVLRQSVFGRTALARFDEVTGVVRMEGAAPGADDGGYYKLTLRGDKWGRGIRLTTAYKAGYPPLVHFREEGVPLIETVLAGGSQVFAPSASTPSIHTLGSLKYYRQDGAVFTSRPFRYGLLLISAVFLGLGGAVAYERLQTEGSQEWYWIFSVAIGLWMLARWGRRVRLDAERRIITLSYFGLLKKSYSYDQFIRLQIVRHLAWSALHNGSDIKMVVRTGTGGATKEVMIFDRIGLSKVVERIVEETTDILRANGTV